MPKSLKANLNKNMKNSTRTTRKVIQPNPRPIRKVKTDPYQIKKEFFMKSRHVRRKNSQLSPSKYAALWKDKKPEDREKGIDKYEVIRPGKIEL